MSNSPLVSYYICTIVKDRGKMQTDRLKNLD